ncbi:MAG: PorV/PorQ family protein [Candidatus Hydrogenedentota bacterium]
MALLAITPAHASQDNAGSNAGISLRFSPSARSSAMGDAFTAEAKGIAAAHYNPAGLGWTDKREIGFLYQDIVLDVGEGSLGVAWPLSDHSAWSVLVNYTDFGTTQRTVVSAGAGANQGTFTGHDFTVSAAYGAKLANWGYGATAKVYSSTIDDADAAAFAADFGLRWKADNSPLSLGLSVRNIGTEVKYDVATERLPIIFRVGAAYEGWWWGRKDAERAPFIVTADFEKIADENWSAKVGAEATLAEMFSMRVGYDGSVEIDNSDNGATTDRGISGLTFGAGFRSTGFEVDYAWTPFGKVGDNHKIGLNYRF